MTAMNELTKYFDLQNKIKELSEEIDLREQIKQLTTEVESLKHTVMLARKNASKHQRANAKLREKYGLKVPSRCEKARELIKQREDGKLEITLKAISEKCFLGYSTVKSLARDMRKTQELTQEQKILYKKW